MTGIELIAAERQRQVEKEGWHSNHDAEHDPGELACAAAAYAMNAADQLHPYTQGDGGNAAPPCWPWTAEWWKPKNPLRDLVRAGALIAAEIDKMRREEGRQMTNEQLASTTPPAIGEPWQGGLYAGISVHDNQPVHLVLLPGDEVGTWEQAIAWAKEQGGELPSRVDSMIFLKNMKPNFYEDWYWTSQPSAFFGYSSWAQLYTYGNQTSYYNTSINIRARAVRRVPIASATGEG